MNRITLQSTFGGLLCELERIAYRAGDGNGILRETLIGDQWAEVRACADDLPCGPAADCVCFARGLQQFNDERHSDGTSLFPLEPIFSHLNGEHPGYQIDPKPLDDVLTCPSTTLSEIPREQYQKALSELKQYLPKLTLSTEDVNALLDLLQHWCSVFPASNAQDDARDISLYDHLKLTASLAACVSEYLREKGSVHFQEELSAPAFRNEEAFLLYTVDFSHIQKFIYTVHSEKALRSLRSRSFFLELLMEHYVDELLKLCGLTRTNIIYSGGGHCYVLLPNTESVGQALAQWNQDFNHWLNRNFGTQLFLANGWQACSANTLFNIPSKDAPYKKLFQQVNQKVEWHKLHPCSPAQLRQLNHMGAYSDGSRECKICGTSARLNTDNLCRWCSLFNSLSGDIQNRTAYLIGKEELTEDSFELPGADGQAVYASFVSDVQAADLLKTPDHIIRSYTKNHVFSGLQNAIGLYVGDYAASNSMEELAEQSEGIPRIAVCRMDVDNLGQAFIAGFEALNEKDPAKRMKYVNLSRAAAFSRQMSLFFKFYLNGILKGLAVTIVYSGGDDVFLVGAWTDVIKAAQRIQAELTCYSCGALTISAGIGIFDSKYPIRASAQQTAEMEDAAKKPPHKNAVALFEPTAEHTYSWPELKEKVLGEKLACLQDFFDHQGDGAQKRGNSMLYNLLDLLRMAKTDRINYARCAYLLSRLEPNRKNKELHENYIKFSHNIIDWAGRDEDRRQLITAIYIYVYQNRKGN